ncbi:unnamed protein product [Adineta ricciae]|uniref:Uncharacterized protein n=1 Tax=Adineta ricciae TaxID=249248 RepID=A0A813W6D2_ADIRI|nr:unnamed protein product [Adineta ricciae]
MSEKVDEEKKDEATTLKEKEEEQLPPEVDAFFKGKNKYKHPYGDWKPVVREEQLKRKTFGDQLDLPVDNWHLPENQPVPVIAETKDTSHVKLLFKEREITSLPSSSSSKANETVTFKKRKMTSNRQLRGASNKDPPTKKEVDEH